MPRGPSRCHFRPVVSLLFCGCLVLAARGGELPAQEATGLSAALALEQTFAKVIEETEPSVVSIARDRLRPSRMSELDEFEGLQPRMGLLPDRNDISSPSYIPNEFGTGIVIGADGLILTNYRLVRGGPVEGKAGAGEQNLYVRLWDRRGFPARIHAADPRSDLAVLKIDATGLKPIKLGNSSRLKKGHLVLSLGNPYAIARDGSASASWGIISNIGRQAHLDIDPTDQEEHKKQTIHHLGTLLQLDMRLNLGTSGAPLLNLQGEMVGLTTSLAAIVGYEKSSGFGVPVDDAMLRVIDTLAKGQEVEYGFLGVRMSTNDAMSPEEQRLIHERFGQYGGARISTVLTNSPAYQAGLMNNDVVLGVNGDPVYSGTDLTREIGLVAPGEKARLRVWRNFESHDMTVEVTVGKWPVQDDEGIIATHRRYDPWRGLVVDFTTARYRHLPLRFLGRDLPAGVLVLEVEPGTPAGLTGLQTGDFITHVNGMPVKTPKQFYDAVRSLKGDVALSVFEGQPVKIKAP